GWHNGWILLHLFYHPKEGRQPSAYTRLETVKHASQDFNIPHAAYSGCAAGHQARRLAYNHRPKGAILYVPSTPRQTVPSFCCEGRAYQFCALSFGISLAPRVFTSGSGRRERSRLVIRRLRFPVEVSLRQ